MNEDAHLEQDYEDRQTGGGFTQEEWEASQHEEEWGDYCYDAAANLAIEKGHTMDFGKDFEQCLEGWE